MSQPVVLCILDGWGISPTNEYNAIAQGDTPLFDQLNVSAPPVAILASGEAVGLPEGQMGNSEVGHLNIGAGRVVYQDLQRINVAIADGSFYKNAVLLAAIGRAKNKGKKIHLIGLLSDGGVHSHITHLIALVEMAKRAGMSQENLAIHAVLDGRDTPPDSGAGYIDQLESALATIGVGQIVTVAGRFYVMDRDKRWDRVERAYRTLVEGKGERFDSATAAITASYANAIQDEFVEPCLVGDYAGIDQDDEVIMFNFRADRVRELVSTFIDPDFAAFTPRPRYTVSVTSLTEYDPTFTFPVAYGVDIPEKGLGEILATAGLTQLRTAETEKYAHVTFFFNGGIEKSYEGEERILVPSPKVRTYDLQPAMSCATVTDGVVNALESGAFSVIIVNLANGDMVGHTGVWEAALEAVKTVDTAVGRIVAACEKANAHLLITADHGNIEKMVEHGKPMTAHTTNPVPLYYLGEAGRTLRQGGRLADIAPTILSLLDIPQPEEMTGTSLLSAPVTP
jgi:2,3-bisphosphoglycerate-independent phosphoglycerate mutase